MEMLSLRALNRATLSRQLLLERVCLPVVQATQLLAGLNAQYSPAPYIGLWTRLNDFHRDSLTQAIEQRAIVRATMMRSTLHLVTAQQYLSFQPALRDTLLRAFRSYFKAEADRLNLERLCLAAAGALTEKARTFPELREHLASIEPGEDPASLSFAVRALLPLVQIPPAGHWRFSGSPRYTLAEQWLNQKTATPDEGRRQLILSYLTAFGPATCKDLETFSGMTGLRAVVKDLEPELRTFVDERGQVLFDVQDGPLPDPDTPAPPRFLPDWDNILLAYADRSRILPDPYRKTLIQTGGHVLPTFLVDGLVAGLWKIEYEKQQATLKLTPFQPLLPSVEAVLAEEGERLLRFAADGAETFAIEFLR